VSRQIRVSDRLYARIEDEKRDHETFGEALERMVDDYGLLDFANDVADASDAWDTEALETEFESRAE